MDPKQLGPFIAARRKELGMTQSELAQKLYVTDKAVSRWERGVGLPDVNSLQPLAGALELTLVELMQARHKEAETISTQEAESLLRETLVLSGGSRRKQIVGGILLCGFGLSALLLLILLLTDGTLLIPVGSLVSGLAAWSIPVWKLTFAKSREAAGAVTASAGFGLVPLGVEDNPRFYRGKKNSFSMRLSAGKLSPVSKALKIGTVLEVIRFTRLRVVGHMMR